MNKKGKVLIFLHILLMVYSLNSILGKLAAGENFLSLRWCCLYGGVIVLLGIYAVGWQQIIKRMPLTSAYANKAVTTVWGLVWGILFFSEKITPGKIAGIVLIVGGVILFSISDTGSDPSTVQTDESEVRE